MLFKFLAASIAISAVAAVPVLRGWDQNNDDHSLEAKETLHEEHESIDELQVKEQSDGIPAHDHHCRHSL